MKRLFIRLGALALVLVLAIAVAVKAIAAAPTSAANTIGENEMSYSISNPPQKINDVGFTGRGIFLYESTDAHGTVEGAGYFSDGTLHGMQLGDLVCVVQTSTNQVTWHRVTTIAAVVGTGLPNKEAARAVTISAATLA